MKQKAWDEFETALLIEAYQKIKEDNTNKENTLSNLSNTLRELAIKRGFEVDDTFRNINGVNWQFGYIERAFKGDDFEQSHHAKVFVDMVDLYKNDYDAYVKILNEAHRLIISNENGVKIQFIKWLKNRIVEKTSHEIADLIENVFLMCCNLCIWDITEIKLYEFLVNDIASNYKFKKSSRIKYNQFFKYDSYYYDFLKNKKNINYQKEAIKISATLDAGKYYKELEKIRFFFNDKNCVDFFTNAFLYSKQHNPEIQLDVRSTIIGVNLKDERLRYYSDKNGIIKIKLSRKDRFIVKMSEIHVDSFYQLIDLSNDYIENNKDEMMIGSAQKNMKDKLENTIEADVIEKNGVEISFYNYLKNEYINNHKNDGKAKRATKHAKRSIDYIKKINTILNEDNANRSIFGIYGLSEIDEIIKHIKSIRNEFDESTYKWYLYVLGMYRSFLKQGRNEPNKVKESSVNTQDEQTNNDYIQLIERYYPDGFSYSNPLRKRKFEQLYSKIYNKEFTDSEGEYNTKIRRSGFESEGKVYPLSIVSNELKNRIAATIEKATNIDPGVIYYSPLFKMYKNELSDLFGEEMFMSYLMTSFKSDYSFEKTYFKKIGNEYNLKQSLIEYFKMNNKPVDIENVYESFPYISKNAINEVIKADDDFIINHKGKSYFYYDVFEISDEELERICSFIYERISDEEQVSRLEILDFIDNNMPMLLEANPDITDFGIKNVLKRYLSDKFSFNGDVISSIDNQLDVKSLYRKYCQEREFFTINDLDEFRNSIHKSYIDYDEVFDICVRIDRNNFVRKDLIEFDIMRTDKALSIYCEKGYTSFNDVVNYNDFPSQQYPWNEFLLESYVYNFSEKYYLLHMSFNKDKPVGAIVSNDANINGFEDLIVKIINEKKLFEKEKALDYLIENCFIMRRRFNEIDTLIEIAKGKEA